MASHDAEFMRLVNESGLGTLVEMPANCQATHAYFREDQDEMLPLKFMEERQQWNFGASRYNGVFVCWMTSITKVLVVHRTELCAESTTTSGVKKKLKRFICERENIANIIDLAFTSYDKFSRQDIVKTTKVTVFARQVYIDRKCCELEAEAHRELMNLLEPDTYKRTQEKCKADAGYCHGDWSKCLAIQVKSRTFVPNKPLNFGKTGGYDGMMLYCRPMNVDKGTLIVPGSTIHHSINLTFKEDTKYYPYIVPDDKLKAFKESLYEIVCNGEKSIVYPSGIEVDVSTLKLYPYRVLCVPEGENNKKEAENRLFREQILPDITYEDPEIEGSSFDIRMNGVKVQDKHGSFKDRMQGLCVKLRKNGGTENGRKTEVPYNVGDFEMLFAFCGRTHVFLIPASELEKRGCLRSKETKGRLSMLCYLPDYVQTNKPADTWTQDYCLDVKDPELHAKVIKLLEASRNKD